MRFQTILVYLAITAIAPLAASSPSLYHRSPKHGKDDPPHHGGHDDPTHHGGGDDNPSKPDDGPHRGHHNITCFNGTFTNGTIINGTITNGTMTNGTFSNGTCLNKTNDDGPGHTKRSKKLW